jgi:hypothetical protein
VCHGYFGDHFFATSIARKLKEENQFDRVDYVVGWPQVVPFFERDPHIDVTIMSTMVGPQPVPPAHWDLNQYSQIFYLKPVTRFEPPPVEMQRLCDVQHPSPDFILYTNPEFDATVQEAWTYAARPLIAIMNPESWRLKAFQFTKEEYEQGVNVPYLGYGGRLRDINKIISGLPYMGTFVGTLPNVNQFQMNTDTLLDLQASVIKQCDFFIGAEGGLANIAAGVGTRTILTSDYVHQLYGWNGCIQKVPEPKLGPRYYFPNDGHIDLDPYLTDEEVTSEIIQIVNNHTF